MGTTNMMQQVGVIPKTVIVVFTSMAFSVAYATFHDNFPVYTPDLFEAKMFLTQTFMYLLVFLLLSTLIVAPRLFMKVSYYLKYIGGAGIATFLFWLYWPKILKFYEYGKQFTFLYLLNAGAVGMFIPITFILGLSISVLSILIRVI